MRTNDSGVDALGFSNERMSQLAKVIPNVFPPGLVNVLVNASVSGRSC